MPTGQRDVSGQYGRRDEACPVSTGGGGGGGGGALRAGGLARTWATWVPGSPGAGAGGGPQCAAAGAVAEGRRESWTPMPFGDFGGDGGAAAAGGSDGSRESRSPTPAGPPAPRGARQLRGHEWIRGKARSTRPLARGGGHPQRPRGCLRGVRGAAPPSSICRARRARVSPVRPREAVRWV